MSIEIQNAISLIKEKTGISIPDNIFIIGLTDRMKDTWYSMGEYIAFAEKIYLRPSLLTPITESDYNEYEQMLNDPAHSMGSEKMTKEQVVEFMSRKEAERKKNVIRVIVHECGHYVHYKYFGGQGMNIPRDTKVRSNSMKNARENFADAFTDYVLELVPADSKRYIKMVELLNNVA